MQPFASAKDAKIIAGWADKLQSSFRESNEDATHGFTSGATTLLSELDLAVLRRELLPPDQGKPIPTLRARILCGILEKHRKHHLTEALSFAGELLLKGVNEASTAIYFIAEFAKPERDLRWEGFAAAHINRLITILADSDDSWALNAVKSICEARPES